MRTILFSALFLSCISFLGCAYHPPINEVPQYGFPEKSLEEISTDPLYQQDLKYIEGSNNADDYIIRGFSTLKHIPYAGKEAIKDFNKAWLLDSLNPHVYMGFALAELELWKGTAQNAINFYNKYLDLYQKNPISRPTKPQNNNEDVVQAKQERFIYGELASLKKDNGQGYGEINFPSMAISGNDEKIRCYLLDSDILPENERNVLNLRMRKNFYENKDKSFYTQGKIKVLAYFDEESKEWIKDPNDSIYEFHYIERTGLFLNEKEKSLVNLGKTRLPSPTARVFLLKPYGFQNLHPVLHSYSEEISESALPKEPSFLKFTPYQESVILQSPIATDVRSGIMNSLTQGNYDSLKTFLDAALEIEKVYGSMPISDREYILLSLLNNSIPNDSIFRKKLKTETLRESKKHSSPEIKDSLNLLITYRLYPQIHTVEFEKKVSIYSHLWWDLKKYVRNQFPE